MFSLPCIATQAPSLPLFPLPSRRFDSRRAGALSAARAAKGLPPVSAGVDGKFSMEVDWIKALPGGGWCSILKGLASKVPATSLFVDAHMQMITLGLQARCYSIGQFSGRHCSEGR
jgi:hypothetical protein